MRRSKEDRPPTIDELREASARAGCVMARCEFTFVTPQGTTITNTSTRPQTARKALQALTEMLDHMEPDDAER